MTTYKRNTKVLIIDRGWLEKQTLYEETFISYLMVNLDQFESKLLKESGTRIYFETVSVMKEINNGKIFQFIDDESKVKEQKMKNYLSIEKEFPNYTARYSSDVIKNKNGKLNSLYVFLVYTESQAEIDILKKRYTVKSILHFKETPNIQKDDLKHIYINSTKDCIKYSKQMIPLLFQDIIKDPMLFS